MSTFEDICYIHSQKKNEDSYQKFKLDEAQTLQALKHAIRFNGKLQC